jgi:putative tricarboxylic transport membrane protein
LFADDKKGCAMKTRRLRPGENLFCVLMLLLSLSILLLAYRISGFASLSSPGAFPMAAGLVMVISMGLVLLGHRRLDKPSVSGFKEEVQVAARRVLPLKFLIYAGIILAYMLLLQPLHFLPSSFLFLVVSMMALRGSGLVKSLLISAGTLAVIYLIFQFLFRVVLP